MKIISYLIIHILSLSLITACSEGNQQGSNNQSYKLKIKYDKEYSDQEKALISRVANDVANKICPNIFTHPDSIENIEVGIGGSYLYQEEIQDWEKQIKIDTQLKYEPKIFGSAAGNYCRFGVGKSGAYVKNKCVKEACQRTEEPKEGMLVTFLPENLDYIEKN